MIINGLPENVMNNNPIFLYGPSGSGKSSVGKILAGNLNRTFIDLDDQIEIRSGMTIQKIFNLESEIGFRIREKDTLSEIIDRDNSVVALGGGTLTTLENRTLVEGTGPVIVLNASISELKRRVENDPTIRPLLIDDPKNKFDELLKKRESHYQSFSNNVDTSRKVPEEIVWDIQILIGMFHLKGMTSGKKPGYDVFIKDGLLNSIADLAAVQSIPGPIVVVTDDNVSQYYLTQVINSLESLGYEPTGFSISAGEASKTIATISKLWDYFLTNQIERKSTIFALGGGVVGDLTGFAAATYLRGVPWVGIPTSLLAMVDSSVGGKTGADLPQGKNLIGSFYPPSNVIIDPLVLKSLPRVELENGMAEVIKHGVIGDPLLFSFCGKEKVAEKPSSMSELVKRALAVKVKIIESDPYEKGLRETLNFGHTIGHGIELVSNFKVRHGEAVAIGMVAESKLGEMQGISEEGLSDVIAKTLISQNLPVSIPSGLDKDEIIKVIRRDKKVSNGKVNFALPTSVGEMKTGIVINGWERILDK